MAKKITKKVKLQIPAGKATPAPPIGTNLGPTGINIGEFVMKFNEQTRPLGDSIIPVEITISEDRSFDFILKTPTASNLILKAMGQEKGSGSAPSKKIGSITKDQLRAIAEQKMPDLNTEDIEQAMKIIAGSARSMGVDIK